MGMRAPMPPQGKPENPEPQSPGKATDLLVEINSKLSELGNLVDSSKLPPEDKQKFGMVMQSFMEFADGLGEVPGAKKPEQGPTGNVDMETGGRPAIPAL